MVRTDITRHNEALAIDNIRAAFIKEGLVEAMRLCQEYMGVDGRVAYERVLVICDGLKSGGN